MQPRYDARRNFYQRIFVKQRGDEKSFR